jgi:hypothetical protein
MGNDAPTCDGCDEPKEYVDEPMVSGYRGWVCPNEGCHYD